MPRLFVSLVSVSPETTDCTTPCSAPTSPDVLVILAVENF